MQLTIESAVAIIAEHFDWLCKYPFSARRRVLSCVQHSDGDFELQIEYVSSSVSLRVTIAGFQMEFGFSVTSLESPPPNPWSSSLNSPEWPEFEGLELEAGIKVRTEERLQRLCTVLSSLCRRYPEYFCYGNFLPIQNKMMAMLNARKERHGTP
jgi:hypothetical protein